MHVEGNTAGSEANYSCIDGYKLVGVTTRVCQDNGEWSDSEPVCNGKYAIKQYYVELSLFLFL